MLSAHDYAVIAFYFAFMLGMGWFFRRFIGSISDYFRGGGSMLWWLVGASAFMTQFSAWTFTGAASQAYREGWPVLVIFLANALGFFFNYAWSAQLFRQMRVVTAMQAVRDRFGRVNEQFFTWLQIPMQIIYAGIWVNGLGVFLSAVFGLDLTLVIVATTLVVLVVAMVGGSWAAVSGDFMQMLVLMPVSLVMAWLALREVGGVDAFFGKLPAGHADLSRLADEPMLLVWAVAIFIRQWVNINNLTDAARYLCVKDTQHARRAGLLACALFIVGPIAWFIPPMAASITHPDLAATFPALKNPSEAAYVAIALQTLPTGMTGLLVCGIFAATMSSMDSALNRNAGYFVKNFYQALLRPHAPERELLSASRLTTLAMGLLILAAALVVSRFGEIGLFDIMLRFGTLVALPYAVPLIWCMLVRDTPHWAGWSTVLVGFGASLASQHFFTPVWLQEALGLAEPLSQTDANYWVIISGLFVNITVCSAWFNLTRLLAGSVPAADRAQVEAFFQRMHTPVDFEKEEGAASDHRQSRALGVLCLGYGGFITLLALIPNPLGGRLGFVFCGGVLIVIGCVLHRHGTRAPGRSLRPPPQHP